MFTNETHATVKRLCKELNTTQASLVNALVEFAIDNCDLASLSLEKAKKRGRKPKAQTTGAVATPAEDLSVPVVPQVEEEVQVSV